MYEKGQIVDERYEIKATLTASERTTVYLVRDQFLHREVVMKSLHWKHADDVNQVKVFVREAEVLGQLEHPHIMPIYDFKPGKHPYFIMRYIREGTLRDLLKAEALESRQVLALAQRLASPIDYLHSKGIIHRNVTPDKIFLAAGNHPYIFDFGYSKVQDRTDIFNASLFRTVQYAAPEVLQEKEHPIDHRADLYSFGILLYECLTGQLPVENAKNVSQASLALMQLQGDGVSLPSVRLIKHHLPPGVDVVLDRLTRHEPHERYGTLTEAVDELTRTFYSGQNELEGQVFISYARKDQEFVFDLVKELRRVGLDIWIDQDIPPGANWDKAVEEALAKCDKLLLIVSPASMLSENVQDEWSYFLEEGKSVYPFIYEDTELSFRLRRRQYIERSGDLLNDVANIVDVLAGGVPTTI